MSSDKNKKDRTEKAEKLRDGVAALNKKQRKFRKEFRDFAIKGDALSLAVGVIIGAAFQGLINSIVNDLINPIIGILFKVDFSNLFIPLFNTNTNETYLALENRGLASLKASGLPVFAYGSFIAAVFNFILLALVVFFLVRIVQGISNRMMLHEKNTEQPKAPAKKKCPFCTEEIAAEATRCPHCTSMIE